PEEDVLAPNNRAREQALAFLAAMLLIVTGLMVAFSRGFSRPIIGLAAAARSFGEGEENPSLPRAGGDEVGHRVRAFHELGARAVSALAAWPPGIASARPALATAVSACWSLPARPARRFSCDRARLPLAWTRSVTPPAASRRSRRCWRRPTA